MATEIKQAVGRCWSAPHEMFLPKLTLAVAVPGLIVLGLVPSSFAQEPDSLPTYQVGAQPNGSVVVPTDQIITPAGTQLQLSGARPNAVAFSPDRKKLAILTAGCNGCSLVSVVDLATNTVQQTLNPNDGDAPPDGIVYSQDGRQLFMSDTNGEIIVANVDSAGQLTLANKIEIPAPDGGTSYPIGLALSVDGKSLYVAISRLNSIGVIDVATQTLVSQISVGNAPYGIAVIGDKAYVSNEGGRVATAGEFTNNSSGTQIVADPNSGGSITGTVSVVNLRAGQTVKTIPVGLQPTGMTVYGGYLFVANTNSDSVSVIDTVADEAVKTIGIQAFPNAPFGSTPTGVAVLNNSTMAVSLGTNNALALYSWQGPPQSVALLGLVPTGWYPGQVKVDPSGHFLVVPNIKGIGSLGDGTAEAKSVYSEVGTVSLISLSGLSQKQLRHMTDQVIQNNGWDRLDPSQTQNPETNDAVVIPRHIGDPSLIKHVFYIIKENRTYDQVLGDIGRGNSDPNLTQFGTTVTPNQHALAQEFPLLDNYYASGIASDEGHQWTDEAYVSSYLEKMEFGGLERGYPYDGGDALAYSPAGFLWEEAEKYGRSVAIFGEFSDQFDNQNGAYGTYDSYSAWQAWYQDSQILSGSLKGQLHAPLGSYQAMSDVPSDNRVLIKDYPPFISIDIPDQYRAAIFQRHFAGWVTNGSLPNLIVMTLPDDHTAGTVPGFATPQAMVADNDLALGNIVDMISHSPYWENSVIFVTEDDAQNGTDHVDGHRTTGFVISPYAKRGTVDSTYYTQIDMVRTIEQILGLPPMNQLDLAATPMTTLFTDTPAMTPFKALPNQIPLTQITPVQSALNGLPRDWAQASARMFLTGFHPDADEYSNLINHANWYATKGFSRPYPGETRVLKPSELRKSHETGD
jgi:YVTN family beta-propeller protein